MATSCFEVKIRSTIQYLGHDSWERQYLFLGKNVANQTLRSLEFQNYLV